MAHIRQCMLSFSSDTMTAELPVTFCPLILCPRVHKIEAGLSGGVVKGVEEYVLQNQTPSTALPAHDWVIYVFGALLGTVGAPSKDP